MRAGACAVQQTLSPEAASVLRHSLLLARRRRHAQLTPVHVAATLLASSSAFAATLRRASPHGHPVHCRALELCFNVALNRLPAAAAAGAAPLLLQAAPSLSNAMVAALKRAQAHQRRSGCPELAQNCLVPVKIDLDQLILSILDDPSVSRAMREAGFSSTSVKTNLEDCKNSGPSVLLGYSFDLPSYPSEKSPRFLFPQHKTNLTPNRTIDFPSLTNHVEVIFDILFGQRRKNVVVVGDSTSSAEGVVSEFVNRLENRDVREDSVKLIKLQFSTIPLGFMKKHEVDMNVGDLKRKVESFGLNGRVVICLGDLRWAVERGSDDRTRDFDFSSIYRNPVDYLVTEIGKLVSWYNTSSNIRVWLTATADHETYMKCRAKEPSLDAQWDLEPVFVPSGGLGSSLNGMSCWDSRITSKSNLCPHKEHENNFLSSCPDYTSIFEEDNGSTQIPYWLKPHGNRQDLAQVKRGTYDNLCRNLHDSIPHITKAHDESCPYPCWPNKDDNERISRTISFSYPSINPSRNPTSIPRFRRKLHSSVSGFDFGIAGAKHQPQGPNLDCLKIMEGKEVEITLSLGSFRDYDRISDLRRLIQENVPWQCEIIPTIVDSLADYCSRETKESGEVLFIEGNDFVGKRRLAVGIAKSVFGSPDMLFCMNMRHHENRTVVENRETLETALRMNEKVVVLIENVNYADQEFVEFLMVKKGSCPAIFVLTNDGERNSNRVIHMKLVYQRSKHGLATSSFLDSHKRKIDWDFAILKGKNQRKMCDETEEVSSNGVENVLDLNIKAHEDDERGNLSSISSDLTREIAIEHPDSLALLGTIKNRFILDRDSDKHERAKEMFLSKLKRSFHNATNGGIGFEVEEELLEEVFCGSGFYLDELFREWVDGILRTSLSMVDGVGDDGDERVGVRLCLDGKVGEYCEKEDGFMGTCLPNRVPLCFQN